MQEDLYWTHLSQAEIAQELTGMGTPVSQPTVKQILDDHGFAKRQIEKTIPGGSVPDRNQQFEHIEELKKRYFGEKNPVFSIDTKKKELLGTLYRKGRSYCQESFQAFDHDFPSWSSGKIVPHGIWDPTPNHRQPRSFEPWHQLGNEPVRLRQFPLVLATDRSSSLS